MTIQDEILEIVVTLTPEEGLDRATVNEGGSDAEQPAATGR
jgi:hypothetical protein